MRNKKKSCNHVLTNGEVCKAIPLRDSNFCYWHHKARARRRRYERIGGPISMEANSGLELPLLEDANAVQVTIQEIMQAILDRRIDNKRAGLLLYSLQLASSNIRNLTPLPADNGAQIANIGSDDEEVFNDTIGSDDRDEFCDEDCEACAEEDCNSRTSETADDFPAKIPPVSVRTLADHSEPHPVPLLPVACGQVLACSGEDDGHVVGLFFAADPIGDGVENRIGDSGQI
jgi:hypothetical protein